MAKLTPTPQEAPYPQKRTAAIDPRWEWTYWMTLSSTRLRRMLKMERKRGVDRHWSYSEPRHQLMLAAYHAQRAKEAALDKLRK